MNARGKLRTVRGRLPGAVIALGFASFFTDVGSEMIFPLLPVFLVSLGAAPAFLGLVEGLADATSSLLKLGSGYVTDRASKRKPLVLLGYAIATLVRPLVAVATVPWHVLAVRVSDRVGKGIRSSPRDVLIAGSVSAEEAGRAFGFHRAMDHAGAMLGPLVASGLLGLGWPLRHVFAAALIPGLCSLVAVAIVRDPPSAVAAPSLASKAVRPRERLPAPLFRYLAVVALFALGNSSDAFLLLRARDLGLPVAAIPLLWSLFHVAKMLSSYFGGTWSDRMGRGRAITLGWALYAATYVGFGLADRAWQIWALFVIYGCHYGLTEPAERALVKQLAPAHLHGRAYGAYHFVVGVMAVPAGVLTGWLWQALSPLAALATGACLAALASAAFALWVRLPPASERQLPAV